MRGEGAGDGLGEGAGPGWVGGRDDAELPALQRDRRRRPFPVPVLRPGARRLLDDPSASILAAASPLAAGEGRPPCRRCPVGVAQRGCTSEGGTPPFRPRDQKAFQAPAGVAADLGAEAVSAGFSPATTVAPDRDAPLAVVLCADSATLRSARGRPGQPAARQAAAMADRATRGQALRDPAGRAPHARDASGLPVRAAPAPARLRLESASVSAGTPGYGPSGTGPWASSDDFAVGLEPALAGPFFLGRTR